MRPNPWGLGVLRWYSGPSNAVTQLISNGAHPIISRLNNLAVSVPGDSTVNSAQLDLEPYTARSSQLWTFTHLGGNIYSVINAQNKSMDIPGGNTDTGVKIQIYYYHSSLYQQVRAMQNPDGTISFLIAGNSWGMTIAGGNMASGGLLTQDYMPATPNSPLHQEWTVGMPAISVPDAPAHLTAGEASGQIKLSWAVTAITTGYNLKRSTTNGGPYAVIASNLVAASFTDTNLSSGVTYYYVVASANQNGESTNSAQASAISGLPAPWLDADMGSVGTAGGASYDQSTGVYTQQGAGGDFGGSGDNCNFLYQSMTNNGTLIARLVFATWMGSIGKIGLMVRETTNSGSISTAILLDHGAANTPRIFNRTSTGGGTSFPGAAPSGITPPLWFKLQRIGNTFISSYSTDGLAWTPVGTNTTVMNSAMCAGLFVCSRNSALATAAFDNVSVTAMPAAPANLMATPGSALATLDWSAANNATGYNVKRSTTSGGSYVVVATNIAALSFTNTGLSNGTLYFYVVSGTNSVGESTNTPEAGVRPVSFTPVLMSASASAGGGIIQLAWPSDHMGWTLQAQTNPLNTGLDTNWVPVAYSSGTNQMFIPVVTTNGSVFYRLIYP
jgi:regulation of enolase protein 1 (concanavalin A-like superfamily)